MSEFLDLSDVNLSETFEPTVQKAGTEAELRVVSCLVSVDKNGNKYFMPFFEILEDPYAKEFGEYLPYPNAGSMSEKELNKAKLKINNFAAAFGVDFSQPVDVQTDLVGLTGWVILGMGKDQDGEPTNKVNKYLAPK